MAKKPRAKKKEAVEDPFKKTDEISPIFFFKIKKISRGTVAQGVFLAY